MSIQFHHTIMHMLDISLEMPIYSASTFVVDDDTEVFITKHLTKLFEDNDVSRAIFMQGSPFAELVSELKESFYEGSCAVAQKYFHTIINYSNIPSGDLLITDFTRDGQDYLGILKLNYKEEYTHFLEPTPTGEGAVNQLIKYKTIFPSSKQRVDEAIIIDLNDLSILLCDHSKEKYMSTLLECKPSLTVKEKIKVVEHVVNKAIEENFENQMEAISHVKNSIAESIMDTSSIPIHSILEDTFADHAEVFEDCKTKFEQYGLCEPTIELANPSTIEKKYSMHKLKTNTGIEIKFPTQMLQNPNTIEFINNPDGTVSILIKNIAELISK